MCAYLPKGFQWEFLKETPVKDIFTSMQHHPEHALRRPDGVFLRRATAKYVLVDFTQCHSSTREDLAKQEQTKREAYEGLTSDLQVQHIVEFFPPGLWL
jgi:hypothetical protein